MNPMRKLTGVALPALLLVFGSTEAQRPTRVPKVGLLSSRPASVPAGREALMRELSALGYIEGKNLVFEFRNADDRLDQLAALADDLVRLKVDVLIAPTTLESQVAKNVTTTIPIVFMNAGDPLAAGLVESFARPGGNITGFTPISPVIVGKRLEILKDCVPKLSNLAVVWDLTGGSSLEWKESQQSAPALGLKLHSINVSSADEYEPALNEARKAGSTALAVTLNSLAVSNQKRIVELAAANRLPSIYPRRDFVESGGLMSYGANREEVYKRVAAIVDKILKGLKPAERPVEQPTKFEFIVNLKAAKQIGLTFPPNVLARADRVIK